MNEKYLVNDNSLNPLVCDKFLSLSLLKSCDLNKINERHRVSLQVK